MLGDTRPLAGARDGAIVDAGPLIDVHVVLGRVLWRIGPAWSVLAGALAGGAPLTTSDALLRLAAAVVLADIGWGILRKLIPSRPGVAATQAVALPSVPYAQPAAPLARFMQFLAAGFAEGPSKLRAAWQSLLAGLGLVAFLRLASGRHVAAHLSARRRCGIARIGPGAPWRSALFVSGLAGCGPAVAVGRLADRACSGSAGVLRCGTGSRLHCLAVGFAPGAPCGNLAGGRYLAGAGCRVGCIDRPETTLGSGCDSRPVCATGLVVGEAGGIRLLDGVGLALVVGGHACCSCGHPAVAVGA